MGSYILSSSKTHTMKFLVFTVCVAVTSAKPFYGLVAHPNGAVVPIDEPAVAAARAEHLAAKGAVYGPVPAVAAHLARGGYTAFPDVAGHVGHGGISGYAGVPAVGGHIGYSGYVGPLAGARPLVAHPNGAVVPVDEPAVAAARADHL